MPGRVRAARQRSPISASSSSFGSGPARGNRRKPPSRGHPPLSMRRTIDHLRVPAVDDRLRCHPTMWSLYGVSTPSVRPNTSRQRGACRPVPDPDDWSRVGNPAPVGLVRNGSQLPIQVAQLAYEVRSRWLVRDLPQRTADRPGAPDWAVGPWGIGLGTDPVRAYVEGIRVPPQETWHQENGVNVVRQAPDRADQLDMIDGLIYEIRWVLLVDNAGRRWEARPDAVPSGSGGTAGGGQTPQPAGAGWPHPPHPRRGSTSPGTPDHQDPTARSYRSMVTLAPPAPVPRRISHYQRRLRT